MKGEPCWKTKRSPEAFIEATHANINEARDASPWCPVKGEPCWKSKREAEASIAASGTLSARDAEPWCSVKGEPCWKNKRAAEALIASVQAGHLVVRSPSRQRSSTSTYSYLNRRPVTPSLSRGAP